MRMHFKFSRRVCHPPGVSMAGGDTGHGDPTSHIGTCENFKGTLLSGPKRFLKNVLSSSKAFNMRNSKLLPALLSVILAASCSTSSKTAGAGANPQQISLALHYENIEKGYFTQLLDSLVTDYVNKYNAENHGITYLTGSGRLPHHVDVFIKDINLATKQQRTKGAVITAVGHTVVPSLIPVLVSYTPQNTIHYKTQFSDSLTVKNINRKEKKLQIPSLWGNKIKREYVLADEFGKTIYSQIWNITYRLQKK
jgi:hypothetical protein